MKTTKPKKRAAKTDALEMNADRFDRMMRMALKAGKPTPAAAKKQRSPSQPTR